MTHLRLPLAALTALAMLGGAGYAAAAERPTEMQLAQADTYGDGQIESFAMAAMQVHEIRLSYEPQIAEAETDSERQNLADEATQAMVGAVEDTPGIDVQQYNEIAQAAAEDPQLAERINELMGSVAQ